jgi:hypothetical protein
VLQIERGQIRQVRQYVAEITGDFIVVVQLGGNHRCSALSLINLANLAASDLLL